jgi:RimJ/RimL family protein N-acetyltransferase
MSLEPMTLENAFVRLEPFTERHREPLRAAAAEPAIWTYVLTSAAGELFGSYFETQIAALRTIARIPHAVVSKKTGEVVGATAYSLIDVPHRTVEIGGTWYIPTVWGGAVNPSCKILLLERAFSAGANRVELKADARNRRSRAAIEKLGAKLDGIMRHRHILPDGSVRDTAYYSILAEEWQEARARLEARLLSFGG